VDGIYAYLKVTRKLGLKLAIAEGFLCFKLSNRRLHATEFSDVSWRIISHVAG